MDQYTEVSVRVLRVTDKAVLFAVEECDDDEIWVPWSQVEDNGERLEPGDDICVYIATWLCEREGII